MWMTGVKNVFTDRIEYCFCWLVYQCQNICGESKKIRIKRERGAPTPVCGCAGAVTEVPRGCCCCCCSKLRRPPRVSLTTRGNQSHHWKLGNAQWWTVKENVLQSDLVPSTDNEYEMIDNTTYNVMDWNNWSMNLNEILVLIMKNRNRKEFWRQCNAAITIEVKLIAENVVLTMTECLTGTLQGLHSLHTRPQCYENIKQLPKHCFQLLYKSIHELAGLPLLYWGNKIAFPIHPIHTNTYIHVLIFFFYEETLTVQHQGYSIWMW